MEHLTPEEVLKYTDHTLGPTDAGRVRRHLESCPECAAEVHLQQKILEAAQRAPLQRVSASFTGRVLGIVGGRASGSVLLRLLAVVGKLLPMVLVLLVLAAALSIDFGGNARAEQDSSALTTALSAFSARVSGAVDGLSSFVNREAGTLGGMQGTKYVLMTFGVLVLFAVIDVVIRKRIFRVRS